MVNIKSFCAICVLCASTKHYVKGVSRTNFGFVYHTITAENDLEIPKSSLYHSYRDLSIYKNSQNTSNRLHSQRNFSTVQHQTIRNTTMESKSLLDLLKANKSSCENLLKRRFFYANSFDIYGGAAGLYDYGPPGCALKVELENLWRQHFVIFDEMLEVSCPCITPYAVLKASGHIDRFTDLMVTDVVNGECYRADKYLEDVIDSVISTLKGKTVADNVNAKNTALLNLGCDELEKIRNLLGNMSLDDVENFIRENNITSPIGNELSKPYPFNLMFETTIGPKSRQKGGINSVVYLRPETAQGIFVNFAKLLESNGGKMPLAAAQIGLGFRNEISPRNGLLRVREFLMAEVEYFVHPKNKTHARYNEFKHVVLSLLPKDVQEKGESNVIRISVEDAVNRGIIANEALGYFLARTSLFLEKCGIFNEGLRFRQHMSDEMAHYACDCWDAEILTSYGWIEVVGHADRMAYDLQAHSKATNIQLNASQRYPEPITVDKVVPNYNRSLIGKTFKDKHVMLLEILNNMTHPEAMKLEEELSATGMTTIKAADGHVFEVTREMLSFKSVKAVVCEETFTPAVIEPSFGIGRLIFCILEHSYRVRPAQDQQEERTYIAIKPMLAPIKCCLLPLSSKDVFQPMISKIQNNLDGFGLSYKIDCTGASIGKRYARMDEIGIPYAITVDFQSLNDGTVTVRERDSMQQIRIDVEMVCCLISDLLRAKTTWEDVVKKHSLFIQQEV